MAIPKFTFGDFFPKTRWNDKCKQSLRRRDAAIRAYRYRKSPENLIKWKRSRAEHRRNVNKSKRDSWQNMAASVNKNTPVSKVWEIVKRARTRGRLLKRISFLEDNNRLYSTVEDISNKLAETLADSTATSSYQQEF